MKRALAPPASPYVGRLAPTPSGLLHIGHARTFHTAFKRCQANGGALILRIEDLGLQRSQSLTHSLTHSLAHQFLTHLVTHYPSHAHTFSLIFTRLYTH